MFSLLLVSSIYLGIPRGKCKDKNIKIIFRSSNLDISWGFWRNVGSGCVIQNIKTNLGSYFLSKYWDNVFTQNLRACSLKNEIKILKNSQNFRKSCFLVFNIIRSFL